MNKNEMYEVKYKDGEWWIFKNGKPMDLMGGFSDPISPKIIIEMIENERN